jgi:hypothetical protein
MRSMKKKWNSRLYEGNNEDEGESGEAVSSSVVKGKQVKSMA